MADNDLDHKRFELEQTVKLAELELKKKELELKKPEKKIEWNSFIPLILGILTVGFSAFSLLHQKQAENELEEKKLLSNLILKAVEKKTLKEFDEQLNLLIAFNVVKSDLEIDSARLADLRQLRFVEEGQKLLANDTSSSLALENLLGNSILLPEDELIVEIPSRGPASEPAEQTKTPIFWMIVAGGDKNLDGAKWEVQRAAKAGFDKVDIWFRGNSYRTVIGQYNSNKLALEDLFIVQERVNKGAYIVRNTTWCTDFEMDPTNSFFVCK